MNTYGRGPVPGEEKNGYVPLGTYQNINLENFGGGPVQYFKKFPYSNFLGRTSQKNHPVSHLMNQLAESIRPLKLLVSPLVMFRAQPPKTT